MRGFTSGFRLAAAGALLVSGVALAGTALAGRAAASTPPGHTIAGAGTLTVGHDTDSAGGGAVDFWKVRLYGGERMSIDINQDSPGVFNFQLYPAGTTDATFAQAASFSQGSTAALGTGAFYLQAPYTGTFVFAVCEGRTAVSCNATGAAAAGRDTAMSSYQFATTNLNGVTAAMAAREIPAAATIARARGLSLGTFQSGGANAADFWKLRLAAGDVVAFSVDGANERAFNVQLYRPGTTDANFASATPVAAGSTNGNFSGTLDLRAPSAGLFVLAVCEGSAPFTCTAVDSGAGQRPMDPYTFTARQIGGLETRTRLSLSARTVTYGHERGERFTVRVSDVYGSSAGLAGTVTISDDRRTVCAVRLARGGGSCAIAGNRAIPVGRVKVVATYRGDRRGSASAPVTLTVRR